MLEILVIYNSNGKPYSYATTKEIADAILKKDSENGVSTTGFRVSSMFIHDDIRDI